MKRKDGYFGNDTPLGEQPYYRYNGWKIRNYGSPHFIKKVIDLIDISDMSNFKKTKTIYYNTHGDLEIYQN